MDLVCAGSIKYRMFPYANASLPDPPPPPISRHCRVSYSLIHTLISTHDTVCLSLQPLPSYTDGTSRRVGRATLQAPWEEEEEEEVHPAPHTRLHSYRPPAMSRHQKSQYHSKSNHHQLTQTTHTDLLLLLLLIRLSLLPGPKSLPPTAPKPTSQVVLLPPSAFEGSTGSSGHPQPHTLPECSTTLPPEGGAVVTRLADPAVRAHIVRVRDELRLYHELTAKQAVLERQVEHAGKNSDSSLPEVSSSTKHIIL